MDRNRLALLCFFIFACVMSALAANPVPFVNNSVVPASVTPGSAGFTLTVYGTGFVSSSVVRWNGSSRTTTYVSSSELQAAISSSDVASAGSVSITVNSGGADSNAVPFWIASPASSISFANHQLVSASAPASVVTADFNGDSKTDIALANGLHSLGNPPNLVGVLIGNGNATFKKPLNNRTAPQTRDVETGDFNGDGVPDLAVSGQLTPSMSSSFAFATLLGNGDGTFHPSIYQTATFRGSSDLLVADFNADGKLDVAATDTDNIVNIAVALGNGDGTFSSFVTSPGSASEYRGVGDFNGDGILDLAGTNLSGPAYIALGNGDGTFKTPTKLTSGSLASAVAVADFNGDGKLDIAFEGVTYMLSVCLGNGDGTFQTCTNYPDDSLGATSRIVVTDLNADGNLDVISSRNDGNFSYLLGNGDGTFQPYATISATTPGRFAIGDFNGDGRADAVYIGGSSDNNNLGLYRLYQHP